VNILDTFFFMFEADVSKVKKGTEEGDVSLKKLKKSVDDVDLSVDKLASNFVNMAKNAAGALAGVLALGAIKALVNDTAAATAATALQARAMNMSVESMSAYQAATISMGGTNAWQVARWFRRSRTVWYRRCQSDDHGISAIGRVGTGDARIDQRPDACIVCYRG